MRMTLPAILAIAFTCPSFAQETPATPQIVMRHVTLQVQREPEYSAQDVMRLLGTPAYLGSIARNLVPKNVDQTLADWTIASDPSRTPLVYVGCEMPTTEILALTFSGTSMDAIERGRDAVLAQLSSIVPTSRATREIERKYIAEVEEVARKRLARAREGFQEFTGQFGEDVESRVAELRNRRGAISQRFASYEQDLASRTATRDYLKQWIDAHRARSDSERSSSSEIATMLEELKKAETLFVEMKKQMTPEHPEMLKLRAQIEGVKSKLRNQDQNERVTEAESRLFRIEEEIFTMTRERDWSTVQLDKLDADEKEWTARLGKFRQLREEADRAESEYQIAATRKRASDEEWSRVSGDPWIRVLAK